ncbi:MAG: autotransporter-associated beta strand repeat-containing protein, partial [Verrucomicrobiales bacterium]|nr:autotransporter-associated beta strand repeat-containing protein [Verrucomicrobiales bacterium]
MKKQSFALRYLRRSRVFVVSLMLTAVTSWSTLGYADTLYRSNSGANSFLDSALTTLTAPAGLIQNYAEGTPFTSGDLIVFNSNITGATTFLLSGSAGFNLQTAGLKVGGLFNGVLLNPGGAITINNNPTMTQTLTLGASGVDLSLAGQNLTLANAATGTLTVATSANQTWAMRTGRTLSLAAVPVTMANTVTIQGAGTVAIGNATAGNAISGAGDLIINGAQSGGSSVVTLSGNNSAWTGAVTVGGSSLLQGGVQLNIDQLAAGQNKLADAKALAINHSTVNLQGTLGGTEVVASVSLGQGLNSITRSAGSGVLQANTISAAKGAALNLGNVATSGSSHVTMDNLNTAAGQVGAWAVGINGTTDANWIKTAASGGDLNALALSGTDYTTQNNLNSWAVNQNIVVTGATTASTASSTIGSLKLNTANIASLDIGAGNTLTINDGASGGGVIGVGNFTRVIGHASNVGQGSLTAGVGDDNVNDTLYFYNVQNTTTVNMMVKDNNTGVGTDSLHVFSGGAGTVTFMANNTYTGGTTIGAGTVAIGANSTASNDASLGTGDIANFGTLVLSKTTGATAAQMTLSNNITGPGAFTINRGVATLSGNNNYSGATTVSATTTLKAGSATGISANSRMLLNAATAILDLNGFDVSVAALRGDQTTANVALGAQTLTLGGSDLANSGSAEVLSLVTQAYQGGFTGTGGIIKNGAYTQTLTAGGSAAYTGSTVVNAGTLQTDKALSTSALTVNNDGSLFISNVANSLTSNTAVTLASAGATWRINNGLNQSIGPLSGVAGSLVDLQNGAGSITLTITDNGIVPTVFNGVINSVAGAGAGSVIKEGTNTWVLGGGNAFSGGLTINGGIVQAAASNPVGVFGDYVPVVLADIAGVGLDVNGNSASIGSLGGGGAVGGNVTLGTAGRLTAGFNNTSTNFGGSISGGTSGVDTFVKVGNGTMILSGANTFLGDVLIRNGTGGLTLAGGSALADTVNIRNFGNGSTLTIQDSETVGAVTGAAGTKIVLGSGATLTTSYTDGTPTVLAATADTDSTGGRVIKGIDTSNLVVGTLISGTSIPAGSYIVQILDEESVLINAVPTPTTTDFAPTITTTARLASDISGAGGFTKNGPGLLFMAGTSTYSGDTTINDGTIQIGGIWTGRDFSIQDQLSDNSQFVFATTGTQNLNFANSATNLLQFERIGSVSGGSVTTSINLLTGSSVAALAIGSDNKSSTFSGRFLGNNAGTWLIKEGTGTFTWNNPTTDVFDGVIDLRAGGFTSGGVGGLDAANVVRASNNGVTFTNGVTDTLAILEGGAGVVRVQPSTGFFGALYGNHLTGSGASAAINTGTVMTLSSGTSSGFNGSISGAGGLTKSGTSVWQLYGAATITGETQVTAGTLRTGILSGSAGVGVPATGLTGSLSAGSGLRVTGGVLDINSTAQSALRFNASSIGGTVQLVNGSLTLMDQNTQSVGTVFTGNLASVLNINSSVASTLTLTGNNTGFGGAVNVGNNAALTLNRSGGAFNSTGLFAANVNLNGTGTQLTVTLADTIGTLAGTGDVVLTQSLTLREAGSGSYAASGFSGATSGAGALILSNFGGLTLSGNTAHSGGITLSSGSMLNLNYGAGNNILPATGALTLNGSTIQIFSTAGVPTILESVASTSLNAGASTIGSWATFAADTATTQPTGQAGIDLGAITRAAGGTLNVYANAAATSTANLASGILGGYAIVDGSSWAVANGAGAAISGLPLGSYVNTFASGSHTDVIASGSGGTTASLRFNTLGAFDVSGTLTTEIGGILVTSAVGANTSTISGALSATANELIVHQYNPLGKLVLSNVAGSNTAITTAGGGTTVITNNLSGTGATTVGFGYLQLGDGGTTGMVGSGLVRNDGTIGINRSNGVALSSIISGTGNLEQLGSGTTTLSAANTFAGRVTVSAGTLEVTNNAGLGTSATAPTNRWANLTTVNAGGTLLFNVAAGGTITELLNLNGGTLDLRSVVATTLAGPVVLTADSTVAVSNSGAAVNHLLTGEIIATSGAKLSFTNVGGATPSTIILAPSATTGGRWGDTSISADARVQIGNNSRGFLGTGTVANAGLLTITPNDANYVIGNTITGAGTLALIRSTSGNTYLTGDLSGFTGTLLVGSTTGVNASSVAEIGNDTYNTSIGTGPIVITSNAFTGTSGVASLRTHLNQDVTMSNTITLNPANDGTNAKNAQFIRAGVGTVTLDGTINLGVTNAGTGTQRNLIQTEAGGKLRLNGVIAGVSANNLLNIVNNNVVVFGGSASNTYNGVLSGNSVWVFDNSGTTTLSGVNTFNTGNTYIRRGTVALTGGSAIQDDNDIHVLSGATLSVLASETIGSLHMQRGASTNIAAGQTLTIDDNQNMLVAGAFTGAGNLSIGASANTQTAYIAMYGTNTATGNLVIGGTGGTTSRFGGIQTPSMANAIGSFATVTLGTATGSGGFIDYVGAGESYAGNIALAGTGTNSIAANGSGGLILTGNLTASGATSTLGLRGQAG